MGDDVLEDVSESAGRPFGFEHDDERRDVGHCEGLEVLGGLSGEVEGQTSYSAVQATRAGASRR